MNNRKKATTLALTLALLCVGPAAGGGAPRIEEGNDPDLSRRCAGALGARAKSAGVTLTLRGDRLRIGKNVLRLSARIDNDLAARSRHVLGVVVDVSVNGVARPLTAGVVGSGSTREEAAEEAVASWVDLVGVALLDALGVKSQGRPAFRAGRFSAHAGIAGASEAIAWTDGSRRELLDRLGAIIRGLESSPSEFHSILIMVAVNPDGSVDGECRVDGAVSEEALKVARSFPWPRAANEYIFKQFYVLRRRP